jgi:hypothetical protein
VFNKSHCQSNHVDSPTPTTNTRISRAYIEKVLKEVVKNAVAMSHGTETLNLYHVTWGLGQKASSLTIRNEADIGALYASPTRGPVWPGETITGKLDPAHRPGQEF